MTLHIGQALIDTLTQHATREYPNECCGILIGRLGTLSGRSKGVRRTRLPSVGPPPLANPREGSLTPPDAAVPPGRRSPQRSLTDRYAQRAVPAHNIAEGDRRTAYQLDWKTLFATVRAVRSGPEDIIGFYHSHPDGSNRPSRRDVESAWIGYCYLIMSMTAGGCRAVTSWQVARGATGFEEEPIAVK